MARRKASSDEAPTNEALAEPEATGELDVEDEDAVEYDYVSDAEDSADDELAVTEVVNAPKIAPPVPRRSIRDAEPEPEPEREPPAWAGQRPCSWADFYALRVAMRRDFRRLSFWRAGLHFTRQPQTFYPADLEVIGPEKVKALLAEKMLVCDRLSEMDCINEWKAQR